MRTLTPPLRSRAPLKLNASFLFKPNHNHLPFSFEDTIKFLKNSADSKILKFGKVIHAHLIISNQASQDHVIQINSLINLYSKCGQLKFARHLCDRLPQVFWSALMAGFLHSGFASEVLELFKTMVSVDHMRPNEYMLATVPSDGGRILEGLQCHGYVLKSGLVFYGYVKNALLRMYSMRSDMGGAMGVLYSVPVCQVQISLPIIRL